MEGGELMRNDEAGRPWSGLVEGEGVCPSFIDGPSIFMGARSFSLVWGRPRAGMVFFGHGGWFRRLFVSSSAGGHCVHRHLLFMGGGLVVIHKRSIAHGG